MAGPEDRLNANLDRARERREELSPVMKQAHEKALSMFKNPAYAVQMEDFKDVYQSQVADDMRRARAKKIEQEKGNTPRQAIEKMIADILEAIILSESELSNWLGDATTMKAADYDDLFNGIDVLAEWRPEGEGTSVLGLAIDVTFGYDASRKKLLDIRKGVDAGIGGKAKYFQDSLGEFRGMRINMPRVVLGVSKEMVEELAALWVHGDKKALGAHPIQRMLLEEMHMQLRAIHEYAKSRGKEQIANSYLQGLRIVTRLLEEKRALRLGDTANDSVYGEILHQTAVVFGK